MKLIRVKRKDGVGLADIDSDIYKIVVTKTGSIYKAGDVLKTTFSPREAKIFIASVDKYGPLKVFVSKWNRRNPNKYNWKPIKLNQEGVVT